MGIFNLIYSDYKMDTQMTVQDYLLKFRKISSLESLEKLFDHLNYSLTDNEEIVNMYRAVRPSPGGAGFWRQIVQHRRSAQVRLALRAIKTVIIHASCLYFRPAFIYNWR